MARKFGEEVLNDIESNRRMLGAAEIAGIVAWTVVTMTDIIQDSVNVVPEGNAKIVMLVLNRLREKMSPHKFDNVRYKKQIDTIDEVAKVLRASCPGAKAYVDIFQNMAKNTLGLLDFAQSSSESRQTITQAQAAHEKNLRSLIKALREIDAKIADDARTDDGGSQQPGMCKAGIKGRATLP